jgi:hypothetical protein
MRAAQLSHWETIRDCDRFQALHTGDMKLLVHLYYGTPYAKFREEIGHQSPVPLVVPDWFEWRIGRGKQRALLNLPTGEINESVAPPRLSPQLHRLLRVLCSDFYRPWGIPSLFERVYPASFFDPVSSPARVHRLIQRLRLWFERHGLPLGIPHTGGGFRLVSPASVHISIPNPDQEMPSREEELLKRVFGFSQFTVKDAVPILKISERSAQRALCALLKKGTVVRRGSTNTTRYSFKS